MPDLMLVIWMPKHIKFLALCILLMNNQLREINWYISKNAERYWKTSFKTFQHKTLSI